MTSITNNIINNVSNNFFVNEVKGCLHGCCNTNKYKPLVILTMINCKRIKSTILFKDEGGSKYNIPRISSKLKSNPNEVCCLFETMQYKLLEYGIEVGFGNEEFFCHYFSYNQKTRIMVLFIDTPLNENTVLKYLNNSSKLVKSKELSKPQMEMLSSYSNRIDILLRDLNDDLDDL
jgi:hypothetical protein